MADSTEEPTTSWGEGGDSPKFNLRVHCGMGSPGPRLLAGAELTLVGDCFYLGSLPMRCDKNPTEMRGNPFSM